MIQKVNPSCVLGRPSVPRRAGLTANEKQLIDRLSVAIQQRAGRRLIEIRIRMRGPNLVIRGIAESFYAWQLTIAECGKLLADNPKLNVDCQLHIQPRDTVNPR